MSSGKPPLNAQTVLLVLAGALGLYYLWSPGRTTLGVLIVAGVAVLSGRAISGKQNHLEALKTGAFWRAIAKALGLALLGVA